jgi:hypothetical protein
LVYEAWTAACAYTIIHTTLDTLHPRRGFLEAASQNGKWMENFEYGEEFCFMMRYENLESDHDFPFEIPISLFQVGMLTWLVGIYKSF